MRSLGTKLQPVTSGAKISAREHNKIVARVNALSSIMASRDVLVRVLPTGITVSGTRPFTIGGEPAKPVLVMNTDTNDLPAFAPAGITGQFHETEPKVISRRVLTVRQPTAEDAGRFVITAEPIPAGAGGWAYHSGMCLVNLMRWFDPVLNHADILGGEEYLIATMTGPAEILWEDPTATVGNERLAVVSLRDNHQTIMDYTLSTGSTLYGRPLVSAAGGASSGLSGNYLTLRPPNIWTGELIAYVSLGGAVSSGAHGRALWPTGPFLAEVDQQVYARRPVGIIANQATFMRGSFGFRVLAYLGTYSTRHYAVLVRDTGPTLLKATSNPSGDEVTAEVSSEDEVLSGVSLTLPTTWNP